MKRVYIAHSRDIDYLNDLYAPLKNADFLGDYELLLPHESSDTSYNTRDFYKSIDLMIAEVSKPAIGLGIELGWAFDDQIPVYRIHRTDSKVSSSIKSITDKIYEYEDIDEMLAIIKKIFEQNQN